MPRSPEPYAIISIVVMIMLGLGILYLNVNGLIDNLTTFLLIVVPAVLIVLVIRLADSDTPDSY
jgi:hypothetical protein